MSEIEQTIEELEAEVLAELEEASEKPLGTAKDLGLGSDNAGDSVSTAKDPAPNVAGADKKETVDGEKAKDLGGLDGQDEKVDKAKDKKADSSDQSEHEIGKKATAAAKPVSGDAQQKSAGKADTPQKLAAGDEIDHDGEELKENKKMTKAQQLEAIAKMKKADIEEMLAAHASKLEEAESAETEAELKKLEDQKAEIDERIKSISVKEDMEALMSSDDTLSEEFKVKAATIFEAAVKSKIRSEIERIDEEVHSEKETEMETFKEEMTEKVDTYLNYVVEEWTKENELAIERGLKGEIAEDFISGLKQLFEDHYIDVPDEKYDVLEAQSEKISELEEKLNEAIQKSVDLTSSNENLVREQVISEVSEDLADTEIEKFKSLTQDIEFGSEDSFREKLDTLKESYFPKAQPSSSSEETFGDEDGSTAQDVDTTDAMKSYMSAISRNQKASA
jgi:hypothetical protein